MATVCDPGPCVFGLPNTRAPPIPASMAQLNLYVAESVAVDLKQRAVQRGVSLSSYVVHLLKPENPPGSDAGWPAGFFEERCGFLKEEIPVPADPPPDAVELLADRPQTRGSPVSPRHQHLDRDCQRGARGGGSAPRPESGLGGSCAVVRGELIFAARKSRRIAESLAGFRALLEPFPSLPFDDRGRRAVRPHPSHTPSGGHAHRLKRPADRRHRPRQ